MKVLLLAAAVGLGSARFAMAADPGMPMEEAPVGFNWTGGYVGGQVGYAWGDSKALFSGSSSIFDLPDWSSDMNPEGFFGGAFAGYNHQFDDGLLLGADADINLASIRFDGMVTGPDGVPSPDELSSTRVNWTAALRGRLGYAFDRVLLFVAGGVTFADIRIDDTSSGDKRPSLDKTLTGWTVGGGADYAFSDRLFGRIEYRYSDFGAEPNSYNYSDWVPYTVDFKTHDIRFGIAYKF